MEKWKRKLQEKGLWALLAYLFVGGCATIVEWGAFWLFANWLKIPYLLATALSFAISTFANWILGRFLVIAKMIATVIVFAYNYLIRKYIIYRKRNV